MGMIIGYEVPMFISVLLVALHSGFTLSYYDMIISQLNSGTVFSATSLGAFLGSIVFILCIPGAAGVIPFDNPEAKTEIVYGYLIEYGGPYLGLLKLAKDVANFTVCLLFFTLFTYLPAVVPLLSGYGLMANVFITLTGTLVVYIITITLPRTIYARVKLRQALGFYKWVWTLVLIASLAMIFNYM